MSSAVPGPNAAHHLSSFGQSPRNASGLINQRVELVVPAPCRTARAEAVLGSAKSSLPSEGRLDPACGMLVQKRDRAIPSPTAPQAELSGLPPEQSVKSPSYGNETIAGR